MSRRVRVHVQLPSGEEVIAGEIDEVAGVGGRHSATPVLTYDRAYLAHPDSYALSRELPLDGAPHQPRDGQEMFSGFQDAMPDDWGRRLIQSAMRREARARGERLRPTSELDLLLRVSDHARQGALRFFSEGVALDDAEQLAALPDLRALSAAADAFARDEATDEQFQLLLGAGSSPGGARPKAHIQDDGRLQIAKFPRSGDPWDVSRWEHATAGIMHAAGIETEPTRLVPLSHDAAVLVTPRFDRDGQRRIGYQSVATMLLLPRGDRVSYERIAREMSGTLGAPRDDAHELFRRAAFNVLVNDTDDHMRNHGFLRGEHGWRLAPAFDVNPMRRADEGTPLTDEDDPWNRDLRVLLDAHDSFDLTRAEATEILREVERATRDWRTAAHAAGVDPEAIDHMRGAFEGAQRETVASLSTPAPPVVIAMPDTTQPRDALGKWLRKPRSGPAGHL